MMQSKPSHASKARYAPSVHDRNTEKRYQRAARAALFSLQHLDWVPVLNSGYGDALLRLSIVEMPFNKSSSRIDRSGVAAAHSDGSGGQKKQEFVFGGENPAPYHP